VELLIGAGTDHGKRVTLPGEGIEKEWTDLTTLDMDETLQPDVVWNLEDFPYPFEDNLFDEIHGYEVLEHTGQQGDFRFFFKQFGEFWRMLKPGGYFCATVPMWNSPWAWADPGHKRIISADTLVFLSQDEYKVQVGKTAMADYRYWWQGDFKLIAKSEENGTLGFVIQAIK